MDKSYQVGGNHYSRMKVQPWDFMESISPNGLQWFLKFSAIKYITRDKENEIEDVKKAIHCLNKWVDLVEKECQS